MRERQQRRVDRVLIGLLALVTAGSGGVVAHRMMAVEPPVPAVHEHPVDIGADGMVQVMFGGDTMLADGAQAIIDQQGPQAVFAKLAPTLKAADYVMVNAEAPITSARTNARPGAKYSYVMKPESATAMAQAGITALALANNHIGDRGPQGMRETVANAARPGWTPSVSGPRSRRRCSRCCCAPRTATSGWSTWARTSAR